MTRIAAVVLCTLAAGCVASAPRSSILVAHLAGGDGAVALEPIRAAFREANPGYDLSFRPRTRAIVATDAPLVVFVHCGETTGSVGAADSALGVGDVVLLRAGETLDTRDGVDALVFRLPGQLPADLPSFLRPDWDPRITDQPGGCATETGAYRRILLTWMAENGPYLCSALNAHRVRIMDSFTHYHPRKGGFDELYLVQMAQPGARVLTSDAVAAIESRSVRAEEARELFDVTPLRAGDLVWLPRGTIHRGLGGVLAQVIAVPGFRPGTEIGVDAHLAALNERLGLTGDAALPVHE